MPYTHAYLTSIRFDEPYRARFLQLQLVEPAPDQLKHPRSYALRNISVIGVACDDATVTEAKECERSVSEELDRRLALALGATPLERATSRAAPDEEPTPAPHVERMSIDSSVGASIDQADAIGDKVDGRANSVMHRSHSDSRDHSSKPGGQAAAADNAQPPAAAPIAEMHTKRSVELQLPAVQRVLPVETATVAPCTARYAAAEASTNGNGNGNCEGDVVRATAVGQGGGAKGDKSSGTANIDYMLKRNRENRRSPRGSPRGSPRASPRRPERAPG